MLLSRACLCFPGRSLFAKCCFASSLSCSYHSEIAPMPSENLGVWGRAPVIIPFLSVLSAWSCHALPFVDEATGAAPISREGSRDVSGPGELQLCAGLAAPVVMIDNSRLERSA